MRVVLCLAAALVLVPLAAASRTGPEPYRRPHVPLQWEQRRAVKLLARRGEPVSCGSDRGNAVALTFDDGPGPYTEQLLAELRGAGAKATFFLVGNRIQYWPDAAREEAGLGAVGNHTWSHPRLTLLPGWLVWLELVRAQWEFFRQTGSKALLFRSPYELHSALTDGVVGSLGLLEVFWSVDSRDDVPHGHAATVARNVIGALRPGAIILMHDIHPWTVDAMPQILRAIRLRHLRAVTVPELLALQPPEPGQHCVYVSGRGD